MKIYISTVKRTIILCGKEDVGIKVDSILPEITGCGNVFLKKEPEGEITDFAGLKTGFNTLLGLDLTQDPETVYFKAGVNVKTIQALLKILLHEIGFMIVSFDGKESFSDACSEEVINKSFTELITVTWRIHYLPPKSWIKLKDNFVGETLHVFGVKALGSLVGKNDFCSGISIRVDETGNGRYPYVKTLMAAEPIGYEISTIQGYESFSNVYKKQEIDKDLFVPAMLYLKQRKRKKMNAPVTHKNLFDMFAGPLGNTVTGLLRTWVDTQMTGVQAGEHTMGIMIRNVAPLKEILNLVQKLRDAGKLKTLTFETAEGFAKQGGLTPAERLDKIRVEMVKEVKEAGDMIHTVAMNLTSDRILEIAGFAAQEGICHIVLFGDGPSDSVYDEGAEVMKGAAFTNLKAKIIKIAVKGTQKKLKVVDFCRLWDGDNGPLSGQITGLQEEDKGKALGYGGQAFILRELFDRHRFIGLCGNKSGGLDLGAINGVPSIQLQVFSKTRMLRERFGTLQLCSPCWRVVPTQSTTELGTEGEAYLPLYIKHLKDNHRCYRVVDAWFYILSKKDQRTLEVVEATDDLKKVCDDRPDLKLVWYKRCEGLMTAEEMKDEFKTKSAQNQRLFVDEKNADWEEKTPPDPS